jgi:hypothetical protein
MKKNILNGNKQCLLVLKNSARRVSWPFGPTGKQFFGCRKENLDHPDIGHFTRLEERGQLIIAVH